MVKLLAYGGGLKGSVVEGDVSNGTVRIMRGDLISHRDISSSAKVYPVNFVEEFTVRKFITNLGETVLVAEHKIVVSDEELQQRIDVLKSLKSLP